MIRLVAIAALVLLAWLVLRWVVRMLRSREVDWAGLAFAVGFVALAFWLRTLTGTG